MKAGMLPINPTFYSGTLGFICVNTSYSRMSVEFGMYFVNSVSFPETYSQGNFRVQKIHEDKCILCEESIFIIICVLH